MGGLRADEWNVNNTVLCTSPNLPGGVFECLTTGVPGTGNCGDALYGTNPNDYWMPLKPHASSGAALRYPGGDGSAASIPDDIQHQGFMVAPIQSEAGGNSQSYFHDDPSGPQRVIKAGSWFFQIVVNANWAHAGEFHAPGAVVYRYNYDAGTFTQLFKTARAIGGMLPGVNVFTWGSPSQPKFYFSPYDTLYVELWFRARGANVTGQTVTLRRNDALGNSFFRVPGGSIGDSYSRTADDVAPAIDTLDEQYAALRPVSDTTSLSETAERATSLTRRPVDSAPATDEVDEQVHLTRAVTELTSTDEDVERQTSMGREVVDSAPATDAVALSYDGGREVADTIPTTEDVARGFAGTRDVSDSAPSADGGADRTVTANRFPTDDAGVSDDAERNVSLTRSVSDSAPATDTVNRAVSAKRAVTEDLSEGGGDVVRKTLYLFDD